MPPKKKRPLVWMPLTWRALLVSVYSYLGLQPSPPASAELPAILSLSRGLFWLHCPFHVLKYALERDLGRRDGYCEPRR